MPCWNTFKFKNEGDGDVGALSFPSNKVQQLERIMDPEAPKGNIAIGFQSNVPTTCQPDGSIAISFCGNIFNYRELKVKMEAAIHSSSSDKWYSFNAGVRRWPVLLCGKELQGA